MRLQPMLYWDTRTNILLTKGANVKTTVQQFNMRLEPDVITKLGRLSEQSGLGRAQVVKRLIREASESTSLPQFLKGGGDD